MRSYEDADAYDFKVDENVYSFFKYIFKIMGKN